MHLPSRVHDSFLVMSAYTQPEMPEADSAALLRSLLQDHEVLRQRMSTFGTLACRLKPSSDDVAWFDLLGCILWEIFSKNHQVVHADGRVYDLGSWRGSGHFIADVLNALLRQRNTPSEAAQPSPPSNESERGAESEFDDVLGSGGPFSYLDFYMGLMVREHDEDCDGPLRLLYAYFFEALKAHGCTWRYAPAAMFLIRPSRETSDEQSGTDLDPASYDPAAAVLKAMEREDHAEEEEQDPVGDDVDEFARELAQANEASYWHDVGHPPRIVQVYREVYGVWPDYLKSES